LRRRHANDRPRQPPKAFFRRMYDLARLSWVLPSTTRCCSMWHTHPLPVSLITFRLTLDLASNPALIRGRKKHSISIHSVEYDWYNERTLGPRIAVVMGRWRLVDLRASFCGSIGTLIRGTMLGVVRQMGTCTWRRASRNHGVGYGIGMCSVLHCCIYCMEILLTLEHHERSLWPLRSSSRQLN
jgi:hypothetical protein